MSCTQALSDFIYNQVCRDLKSWSFDSKTVPEMMNNMEKLMLGGSRHAKMMVSVTIDRNGVPTFDTCEFKNITFDQIQQVMDQCSKSSRVVAMMKMIYITSRKYTLPPVKFYIYTNDSYCYEHRDLPLFVFAKPSNREGILLPDNSFITENASDWNHLSWKYQIQDIRQNSTPFKDKLPIVFFKGQRTGPLCRKNEAVLRKWGTRCAFEKHALTNKFMQVEIGNSREPMHAWTQYKYLLNLPGAQPWSYRFKYLLATGSVVIDIVVQQQYGRDPTNYNERWDNVFDGFFRPGRDYVQIPFRWIKGDAAHNDKENTRVLQKLAEIFTFFEQNENSHHKMVQNCEDRLRQISETAVFHTLSIIINEYARALNRAKCQ
jgi:hypothetical protein